MAISLISLPLPSPGFYNFISTWIFEHDKKLFIVDPGPTNSLPILYNALGDRVPDYILLTHIHVDHAGGIGDLCERYPRAKIVVHEKGHRHLVDPVKLVEGSRKTLGELMDLYGEIKAVKAECFLKEPEIIVGLEIIKTPGHATHHVSFVFDEYIFCGEALGVICPTGNEILDIYLRPATPPVFDLEAYLSSIALLERVYNNQTLCFGHYGFGVSGINYFQKARDQIELWCRVVKLENLSKDLSSLTQEQFAETLDKLSKEDPNFRSYGKLPADIQERELRFILNSIKGIIGLDMS